MGAPSGCFPGLRLVRKFAYKLIFKPVMTSKYYCLTYFRLLFNSIFLKNLYGGRCLVCPPLTPNRDELLPWEFNAMSLG
jgi:hypothetical protein